MTNIDAIQNAKEALEKNKENNLVEIDRESLEMLISQAEYAERSRP